MEKTKHTEHHAFNHLFSEKYNYDGDYPIDTKVLLVQFNEQNINFSKIEPIKKSVLENYNPDCINWFDIVGLNNTDFIQDFLKAFDFFPVDAKPVLTPCHAAKIDYFNNRLIVVMRPCFFDKKNNIALEHICILSRDNIVITFREQGEVSFDNVIKSLRLNTMGLRYNGNGMLIAFLINSILSVMIGTAIKVEETLENIDALFFNEESADNSIGKKLQQSGYANLILQKNSVPLKDEFDKLISVDFIQKSKVLMPVYLELYNQLDYVLLTSESCKDLLNSLRESYSSTNELKTNSIVKRLTIVATFFIPITFLVGLWGMNFELMPEVKWKYGYLLAWLILSLTVILTWYFMKKNKWF